jgi:hypothetical protein
MTQHLFNGETPSDKAALDSNFSQLFPLLPLVPTITVSGGFVGIGKTPTALLDATAASSAGGSVAFNLTNTQSGASSSLNITGTTFLSGGVGGSTALLTTGSGNTNLALGPSVAGTGVIQFVANAAERMRIDASGNGTPGADNAQAWGSGSRRWSVIYAGTGTINTSDAREKTAVLPMTGPEISAAKALASEIGTYQWLAALQAKGSDARAHIGMTVQRAIEIMSANGLTPTDYGFICHDSWPAVTASDGTITQPAGDRYAFRPDELLLFIARGFDARLTALEAR